MCYSFLLFWKTSGSARSRRQARLLRWVCLTLTRINWYHMARWQHHSIFRVPEHHINHFLGVYSFPFITQEFPNSPCLYFSHTCSEFTCTGSPLPSLGAGAFDQDQAGAGQEKKNTCQVTFVPLQTCFRWSLSAPGYIYYSNVFSFFLLNRKWEHSEQLKYSPHLHLP